MTYGQNVQPQIYTVICNKTTMCTSNENQRNSKK